MFASSEKMGWLLLCVFIAHYLPLCIGHSTGAPDSRCGTMVPGHWVAAQTTPSPFQIQLSSDTIEAGDTLQVNLTGSQGQTGFKGFLIQVKRPGQIDGTENFGSFDPFKSDNFQSQPISCFGNPNSALTHKDPVEKHFVSLAWIAPKVEKDEVFEVRVTFVENFWKFWPNQTPGKLIRVTKRAINSTEDATSGNKTTIIYSTPLSPAHPRPGGILTPKLRDVDTVSDNVTGNGANNSSTYFNMKGSWDHFKTSWMNFLHYFGF